MDVCRGLFLRGKYNLDIMFRFASTLDLDLSVEIDSVYTHVSQLRPRIALTD